MDRRAPRHVYRAPGVRTPHGDARVRPADRSRLVLQLHLHALVVPQARSAHNSAYRFDVAAALADDLAHVLFGNLQPHNGAATSWLRLDRDSVLVADDPLSDETCEVC